MTRTRFAPSPTGDLHLGGAWTALASWAIARAARGQALLRVEDIDTPRVIAGSRERIAEDLAWLGLDWEIEASYTQSRRTPLYLDALARLESAGLTYPCDCSRAEIALAASAPHGVELVYPGTCRRLAKDRPFKREPATRLAVPEASVVGFRDGIFGDVTEHVGIATGDFVLRRADGVFSYQLVVAVDDAAMQITDVVRGVDLLASTPRQIMLMRLLGYTAIPRYAHVPLVLAPDGTRLAKRTPGSTVRELRERGMAPERVVGELAAGLGLVSGPPAPRSAAEVASKLAPLASWRRASWPIPGW